MNWKKLAFMLELEARRIETQTFPSNPSERIKSIVVAGLSASYILGGLAKCIRLANEVEDGSQS